jgi:allophanate hydrolase
VEVALGLVDIAIGTDTAGSGRVPAGLQGIVGIKPTLQDAVTIFSRHLSTAELGMGVMGGSLWTPGGPASRLGRGRPAIEFDAFLEGARLLYGGALVAERYAAVEDYLETADGGTDGQAGIDTTGGRHALW